jgi:hypothetical protein
MDSQLNFLIKSAKSGSWIPTTKFWCKTHMKYKSFIKSKKNAYDLAIIFHASYERSGDNYSMIKKRAKKADE